MTVSSSWRWSEPWRSSTKRRDACPKISRIASGDFLACDHRPEKRAGTRIWRDQARPDMAGGPLSHSRVDIPGGAYHTTAVSGAGVMHSRDPSSCPWPLGCGLWCSASAMCDATVDAGGENKSISKPQEMGEQGMSHFDKSPHRIRIRTCNGDHLQDTTQILTDTLLFSTARA